MGSCVQCEKEAAVMLSRRNRAVERTLASSLKKAGPISKNRQGHQKKDNKSYTKRLILCFLVTTFALMSSSLVVGQFLLSKNERTPSLFESLSTYGEGAAATSSMYSGKTKPTNTACDGYRGIYHIEKGDIGGAAGTVFFQFVIGQLIWAEKYNFKPWVYFNNISYIIYDPLVHGRGAGVNFTMLGGANVTYINRPNGQWRDSVPGPPGNLHALSPKKFIFTGNGVWENYFEPVSDFVPGDKSCENKPLVTMDLYLVTPGVHGFAEWAPRCWRYQYLPDYITKPHIPLQEWLEPQRKIANRVLNEYIRFLPYIKNKAEGVNPSCALSENSCLGIHIRQSDKAAGRRQIQTDEFLPYVEAFIGSGGQWVYLATDSVNVVQHIKKNWPAQVQPRIRSMGDDIIRSKDDQAVFDIGSHHQTNTEILIEILALSKCQFMIHGLSAVTETSIWINVDLHYTSVNLEDPDHLNPNRFGALVGRVLEGENASQIVLAQRKSDWWKKDVSPFSLPTPTHAACNDFDGVLLIAEVGHQAGAGTAFFSSVVNQLIYAERYNLIPWIRLGNESEYIYDSEVHGTGPSRSIDGSTTKKVQMLAHRFNSSYLYPGPPASSEFRPTAKSVLHGNGIWESYFSQVSDFHPDDTSCLGKPLIRMDHQLVTSNLNSWAPWSVKAWRYDQIPDELWKPDDQKLKEWLKPMRTRAHEIVEKYFKFHPFIEHRALEVNPVNGSSPCLAVHLRNSDKGKEKFRTKFPPNKFRDYMQAFVQAGGRHIYIASDSHRTLEYINDHFPPEITRTIRTQGPYVVRSTKKWPIHFLEKHHRTNLEALVDILAVSKCSLLLHGNSAVSEAAVYLNPELHDHSVNWEDTDRMSVPEFRALSQEILRRTESDPIDHAPIQRSVDSRSIDRPPRILQGSSRRRCRKNAIVYLAQKRHSSYQGRDSYGMLLKSFDLVYKNYLSLNNHANNTDLIIFHTDDFGKEDLDAFESRISTSFRNLVRLVDISNTTYWKRPKWHENDDPADWYAFPLFSEGYRRMMHFFAIDIWHFFSDHRSETGCNYEYIMRFDEDSYLHSPIRYDVFDFMKTNDYYYGFRLCAYELQVTQRVWKLWTRRKKKPEPIRDIDLEMCGVYNNFFIAKLSHYQSPQVQDFLHFVDRQGFIYRRRLGDLMIHSMATYAFTMPEKIHRFLDFTYEHGTVNHTSGCVVWGGIQAGFDDPSADQTLDSFYQKNVVQVGGCSNQDYILSEKDLSPTYSHLPPSLKGKIGLRTIMAGKIELPDKGILSG
eukprot:scaffold1869_cov122-Cylindrotheca_fusiformis.AAC.30